MRIDFVQQPSKGDEPVYTARVGNELVAVGTFKECGRQLLQRFGVDAMAEAVGTLRLLRPPGRPPHEFEFKNIRAERDRRRVERTHAAILAGRPLPEGVAVPGRVATGLGEPQKLPPFDVRAAASKNWAKNPG